MASREKDADNREVSFTLIDENTVKRLRKDGEVNLPKKKVDIPKDKRWNKKQMNSMLLEGIENGDSADDIAKRMFPELMSKEDLKGKSEKAIAGIIRRNRNSSIRNARTMFTSAENHGRLDSYKNLQDQGVVLKKEWIATPDDRTRPSHIDIDGEQVDPDERFSNGCMFPGDGDGPSEEVWMCRCTMGTEIVGFKASDGSVVGVGRQADRTMHEDQMKR